MADPKGLLVVPVAFRPDGTMRAWELDNSDRLKVLVDAITGDVSVTQTNPANLQSGINGWINAAWQKQPLIFGYSGDILRLASNTNLAAGTNQVNDSAVPAGEIWVVTSLSMAYVGTVPTSIRLSIVAATVAYRLFQQNAPVSDMAYDRQGYWIMQEGDNLRCTVLGATAGDDLFFWVNGFRLDIDQ